MILIVPKKELADEIACTPDIEDGVGPVMLGIPIELKDGRFAYIHPWNYVTVDWLKGYTLSIKGAEVLETDILPYPVKEIKETEMPI